MIYNFAYGSNLFTARLRRRTPSARRVGVRQLVGYRLRWDKVSKRDGSRKCDAECTGHPHDIVWGVLYEIAEIEEGELDKAEGLGFGYKKECLELDGRDGTVRASIYIATEKRDDDLPLDWYKAYVIAGAKEHGLPSDYVLQLEGVPAKVDPDRERAEREFGFLRTPT